MKRQILREIRGTLRHMAETGKTDPAIFGNLNDLRELLETIKTKWVKDSNTDGFYFYHAARAMELILNRMTDRLEKSEANNDPKITRDALVLLPALGRVLEVAETDEITPEAIDTVLLRTGKLRETARSTNLIETLEERREGMDVELLERNFNKIMEYLCDGD